MVSIYKYPRTRHIEGSGLQADDDPNVAPFNELAGKYLVVEEKMDGANCGLSFDTHSQLRLQSRGHYLTGGPRERQFELLKSWAARYTAELWALLSDRYILYGEWLYGKHSIFYTDLPHYFLEFDLYDTQRSLFLPTAQRQHMLQYAPFISSVRVVHTGPLASLAALTNLIGPSPFVTSDYQTKLAAAAQAQGLDPTQAIHETDTSGLMEGLYVKVESTDAVLARYKFVRPGFVQTVLDAGNHWMQRPLLPNQLHASATLW